MLFLYNTAQLIELLLMIPINKTVMILWHYKINLNAFIQRYTAINPNLKATEHKCMHSI